MSGSDERRYSRRYFKDVKKVELFVAISYSFFKLVSLPGQKIRMEGGRQSRGSFV